MLSKSKAMSLGAVSGSRELRSTKVHVCVCVRVHAHVCAAVQTGTALGVPEEEWGQGGAGQRLRPGGRRHPRSPSPRGQSRGHMTRVSGHAGRRMQRKSAAQTGHMEGRARSGVWAPQPASVQAESWRSPRDTEARRLLPLHPHSHPGPWRCFCVLEGRQVQGARKGDPCWIQPLPPWGPPRLELEGSRQPSLN